MNRNIILGIASILIGLIGLGFELYFDSQLMKRYEELGALREVICAVFKYGDSNRYALMALSISGITLGSIAIVKDQIRWPVIGTALCLWNFIELFTSS